MTRHPREAKRSGCKAVSRGRNAGYPAPPAQTRTCGFPASGSSVVLAFASNDYANTRCIRRFSVILGTATPRRFNALVNDFQVKLLRLPPLRLSHLKAHRIALL